MVGLGLSWHGRRHAKEAVCLRLSWHGRRRVEEAVCLRLSLHGSLGARPSFSLCPSGCGGRGDWQTVSLCLDWLGGSSDWDHAIQSPGRSRARLATVFGRIDRCLHGRILHLWAWAPWWRSLRRLVSEHSVRSKLRHTADIEFCRGRHRHLSRALRCLGRQCFLELSLRRFEGALQPLALMLGGGGCSAVQRSPPRGGYLSDHFDGLLHNSLNLPLHVLDCLWPGNLHLHLHHLNLRLDHLLLHLLLHLPHHLLHHLLHHHPWHPLPSLAPDVPDAAGQQQWQCSQKRKSRVVMVGDCECSHSYRHNGVIGHIGRDQRWWERRTRRWCRWR